jgi:predicted RNA-binding Zn-ribbon protein involved in translation (DUF1610 family)
MTASLRLGRLDIQIAGSHITLSGRMDETSRLEEMVPHLPPGDLVFDCEAISFVNSFGMREWVRLVRALSGRVAVTLERVADTLMTQMNLIPELAHRLRITSFHAQYVCPACGADAMPLIDAIANGAELAKLRAPEFPCPECGSTMELGDFPERYLGLFCPP